MSKDKKQMLVLGVLVLVVLAVGAFQFLGGKSSSAPAVADDGLTAEADGEKLAMADTEENSPFPSGWDKSAFLSEVDKRDPFIAQAVILKEDDPEDDPPPTKPTGPTNRKPDPEIGGGTKPFPVEGPGNATNLTPGRPQGEPPFSVAGIIEGSRSTMAILSPDDGAQRVVSVGDQFGDMKIVAIHSNKVDVIYKGKNRTLSFRGGN